jgi:signal transduction histidine kinase
MERVAADPAATYAIIEVVREAVGNAIRHGNATTIEIGIHDQASDLVGLVITDNGSGLTDGAAPGVGSHLFDALAYEWSRNTSPAGTTITAELTWSPAP